MGQKASVKNQEVELLMEGQAMFSNFTKDIRLIEKLLDQNEKLDHDNDKLGNECDDLLLDVLEALSAKNVGEAEANVRAAMQKRANQRKLDLRDDSPRLACRIKLAEARTKAINNERDFIRLQERLSNVR